MVEEYKLKEEEGQSTQKKSAQPNLESANLFPRKLPGAKRLSPFLPPGPPLPQIHRTTGVNAPSPSPGPIKMPEHLISSLETIRHGVYQRGFHSGLYREKAIFGVFLKKIERRGGHRLAKPAHLATGSRRRERGRR